MCSSVQPSSIAVVLLSNGAIAFALNLSVFMLIGKTSALAMNVAGVVKDWLLIGLSSQIFHAQVLLRMCQCTHENSAPERHQRTTP